MRYIIPHYFDDFRCVAAECEDTCCAGWQIMIDEESLERYKTTGGSFGERLKKSINWEEGCFHQYGCKRCAFLNDDNLCDMQMIGGEQMLCATCRDYPRHMEEYEGLREGSLSLSCIEAAKLILGSIEPVQFYSLEDDIEDEEYEDFDFLLFDKLMDARERMLELLQNREADIRVRMALVLHLANEMQKAIDETNYRRDKQMKYNEEHNVKPMTIKKAIVDSLKISMDNKEGSMSKKDITQKIELLKGQMDSAAKRLDFETAINLREEISKLKKKLR